MGLGLATAIHLARLKPAHLILGVRDLIKGAKAKEEIIAQTQFSGTIDVWELDMAKFESVKGFAPRANSTLARLDGAIVNAGVENPRTWDLTSDGWENTLQINGIATGLLAVLLLPILQATTRLPSPHPDGLQMPPHLTITSTDSGGQFLARFSQRYVPNILETLNDKFKWIQPDRYFITKSSICSLLARLPRYRKQRCGRPRNVHVGCREPRQLRAFVAFLFRNVALPYSKGALNLVYAVVSPTPSGAFISSPPAWVRKKDGIKVQKKVWDEMVEVWRGVSLVVDELVRQ
ncbi:hypothetical protein DFH09DRAFT_1091910 [Mycena vulgaris]|nr:hypothetical protein DFH09DRAFT_1091910 [Mycena vulgaris]